MDSGGGTCVASSGDDGIGLGSAVKMLHKGGCGDDDDGDPAHRRRKHYKRLDDGLEPIFIEDDDDDDEDDGDYLPVVLPDRVGGPR